EWLNQGFALHEYPQCNREPDVYPQGSINLGTIVRPLREGKEADFDIDLVCELKNSTIMEPRDVKGQVGNRLKKNQTYKDKLEPEGKRCWTLDYAKSQGIGFHMDILPSIPDATPLDLKITHKNEINGLYSWTYSSPKKYSDWFRKQNKTFGTFAASQRRQLFEDMFKEDKRTKLFEKVEDVPEQLVRTPLQRTIQILKRHRDVNFLNKKSDYKPISIIITTLAANLYDGENDVYDSLINIINKLRQFSGYIENAQFRLDEKIVWRELITRFMEGGVWKWRIKNPTNEKENFADRWHEDNNARAKAFFEWVEAIYKDVQKLKASNDIISIRKLFEELFYWKIPDGAETRWGIRAPAILFPSVQPKSQPKPWS
ncbi:MAG TPA: nucleotidyltransferase, partial [Candidatus Omnitrophota bacterium]|nr:nucleotidyltransferase [Candidatus Omnitrophota bacterium]